jgi:hypothetical protein
MGQQATAEPRGLMHTGAQHLSIILDEAEISTYGIPDHSTE